MSTRAPEKKTITAPKKSAAPVIRVIGKPHDVFDDLYHYIINSSWPKFIGLGSAIYMLVNCLFALLYFFFPNSITNFHQGSFVEAFSFSIQTMSSIGNSEMAPQTPLGHLLVLFEAIVGLFATALLTGVAFAKFARPTARVLFCEKAVICPRNGIPHLMFRLANWRHNAIVDAQVRVVMLAFETTREGDRLRRQIELPLVQSHSIFFMMSFNVMHLIDEKSPFFGPGALDKLQEGNVQIVISIVGYDETLAQTITARHLYYLKDIIPNHRFHDVMAVLPDESRIIDYTKFHQLIPIEPT